jgi:hypothetical protein
VDTPTNNLIDSIPASLTVRERLTAALREVQLLRDLLKIAERKERQEAGERPEVVAHGH